jgi:predicted transcriptional regulator
MFVKRELAAKVRELRQVDGMSMKQIASLLAVSLSSVSRWTLELTPVYRNRILSHFRERARARRDRTVVA